MLFGYKIADLLKIVQAHEEAKQMVEQGLPLGFIFPFNKRNEWAECVNELRKQGFKIVPPDDPIEILYGGMISLTPKDLRISLEMLGYKIVKDR